MSAVRTTKWGDRQQRRIDILDAARERIVAGGYVALNMRDIAAGAGVSPATLYSYFATKEELFATLYAQAIRAHTEAYRPVAAAGHDLPALLARVIERHIELYRTYGRYLTLWSAVRNDTRPEDDGGPGGADSPGADGTPQSGATARATTAADRSFPAELIVELRAATREHNRLLMDSIREAAAREGRRVADERMVPSFLWSALTGLSDHVTSERRALDGYPADRLVQFAADRLALAITEPA
jgi:AcrR family transcriptional regulator